MDASSYSKAVLEFMDRVLYDGSSSLKDSQQGFPHAVLEQLVSTLSGKERLVTIHLGLEQLSMRYGLSFCAGRPTPDGLEYDAAEEPTHILKNNSIQALAPGSWHSMQDTYFEHVHLKRGDGAHVELDKTDTRMVTLHWDKEIDRMYQETTRNLNDTFRLVVSSVSIDHDASDGGHAGYRHTVSFHCEQKITLAWKPLLNDKHDPSSIFNFKAADYGVMCPPRCTKFKRP